MQQLLLWAYMDTTDMDVVGQIGPIWLLYSDIPEVLLPMHDKSMENPLHEQWREVSYVAQQEILA